MKRQLLIHSGLLALVALLAALLALPALVLTRPQPSSDAFPSPYAALRLIELPSTAMPPYFQRTGLKASGTNQWGNGLNGASEVFTLPPGYKEGVYGQRVGAVVAIFPTVAAAAQDIATSHASMVSRGTPASPFYVSTPGDLGDDAFMTSTHDISPHHMALTIVWRHGAIEAVWAALVDTRFSKGMAQLFSRQISAMNQQMLQVAAWQVPIAQS